MPNDEGMPNVKFPYALIYQGSPDLILIVAVQSLHRHPDSWKSRLRHQEV